MRGSDSCNNVPSENLSCLTFPEDCFGILLFADRMLEFQWDVVDFGIWDFEKEPLLNELSNCFFNTIDLGFKIGLIGNFLGIDSFLSSDVSFDLCLIFKRFLLMAFVSKWNFYHEVFLFLLEDLWGSVRSSQEDSRGRVSRESLPWVNISSYC